MGFVVRLVSTLVSMSLLGPAPRLPVPPLKPIDEIYPLLPLKTVEEVFGDEDSPRTAQLEEWELVIPILELADLPALLPPPRASREPVPRFSDDVPGPLKSWQEIYRDPG